MKPTIGNIKEFSAGVLFLAFGGFVLLYACSYPMGTATQMGPGYFPAILAILLCGLGLIAIVQGLCAKHASPIGPWPLVPGAFVIAGVLGFAALIGERGLLPAVAVLVPLSCYERLLRRSLEVVVIGVAMLALTYVIFIYAIELPIDFW